MISKKLRKKLKHNKFEVDIFQTNVFVVNDKDVFQSIYDDIDYKHDATNSDGLCLYTVENGKKDIFIGIFCERDDVIVHECTHASLYILDSIEEVVNCNSELQPYLIQTLFRNCKRLLR